MALLDHDAIETTIKSMGKRQFMVLDFGDALRKKHPQLWALLVGRFGEFGEKSVGPHLVRIYSPASSIR
jgi:hypothetical protein